MPISTVIAQSAPQTGVSIELNTANGAYDLYYNNIFQASGAGLTSTVYLNSNTDWPMEYEIRFHDADVNLDGELDPAYTPDPFNFNLVYGNPLNFVVNYEAETTQELVTVNLNVADGAYDVYYDGIFQSSGAGLTSSVSLNVSPSFPTEYEIRFHDADVNLDGAVDPAYTPDNYVFNLEDNAPQTLNFSYANEVSQEVVTVNLNIANGGYDVYYNDVYQSEGEGLTSSVSLNVSPNFPTEYEMRFRDADVNLDGALDPAFTPDSFFFNLEEGTPLTLNREYTDEVTTVLVTVNLNIPHGAYNVYLTDGNVWKGAGSGLTSSVDLEVSSSWPTEYQVIFVDKDVDLNGTVDSDLTPDSILFNLSANSPLTISAEYDQPIVPTTGTISLLQQNDNGDGTYANLPNTVTYLNQDDGYAQIASWQLIKCATGFIACNYVYPGETFGDNELIASGSYSPLFADELAPGNYKLATPSELPVGYTDGGKLVYPLSNITLNGGDEIDVAIRYTNNAENRALVSINVSSDRGLLPVDTSFYATYTLDGTAFNTNDDIVRTIDIREDAVFTFNAVDDYSTPVITPVAGAYPTGNTLTIPANTLLGNDTAYNLYSRYSTEMSLVNVTIAPDTVTANIATNGVSDGPYGASNPFSIELNSTDANTLVCESPAVSPADYLTTNSFNYVIGDLDAGRIKNETCNYVTEGVDLTLNLFKDTTQFDTSFEYCMGTPSHPGTCTTYTTTNLSIAASGLGDQFLRLNEEAGYSNPAETSDENATDGKVEYVLTAEDLVLGSVTLVYSSTTDNLTYINVWTTPVEGNVQMLDSTGTTTVQGPRMTGPDSPDANYYALSTENLFSLPIPDGSTSVDASFQIECLSIPGGFEVVEDFTSVSGTFQLDQTTMAAICAYQDARENKVTLTLDTIGQTDAAIYIDGIEVRSSGNSDSVLVDISTTDDHFVSFEDRSAFGYRTPANIYIPEGSLTEDANVLGYYVRTENSSPLSLKTRTVDAHVYLTVGSDPTPWLVGGATIYRTFILYVDNTSDHQVMFTNKNNETPAYALRTAPNNICSTQGGADITQDMYQENYFCAADTLPTTVTTLTGQYINYANAAYFQARTDAVDGVFYGDITLALNSNTSDAPTVLTPAERDANGYTRIFVADVVTGSNAVNYESPVTIDGESVEANPTGYVLDGTSPYLAGNAVNTAYNLESSYSSDIANVTIQTYSTSDTYPVPAGTLVNLDGGAELIATASNNGSVTFEGVSTADAHTITCPHADPNLQAPSPIRLPAGSLSAGDQTFTCLYVPVLSAAQIKIETTSVETTSINLPTAVTINVGGVNYNIGYTSGVNPTEAASLLAYVDTDLVTYVATGNVAGFINPGIFEVDVAALSDSVNNPDTNIFTRTYVLFANGGYSTIHSKKSNDGDSGLLISLYEGTPEAGTLITTGISTIENILLDNRNTYTATFADDLTGEYITPGNLTLDNSNLPVNAQAETFNVQYVFPNAYISVAVENNDFATVYLNGTAAVGIDGNAYVAGTPMAIDYDNVVGNTISFSPFGGKVVPAPIVIPQSATNEYGLSTDQSAPTAFNGKYVDLNDEGFVDIVALHSETNVVLETAAISLNNYIVGYGQVENVVIDINDSNMISFGQQSGLITPLGIYNVQESDSYAGFYVPEGQATPVNLRTVDENTQFVNGPILFSNDNVNTYRVGTRTAQLYVNNALTTQQVISYGPLAGYIAPSAENFDPIKDPQLYTGVYVASSGTTVNVYTMDESAFVTTGVTGAEITLTNLDSLEETVISSDGTALNVPVLYSTDYRVSFGAHTNPAYATPQPIYFNLPVGTNPQSYLGVYSGGCAVNLDRFHQDGSALMAEVTATVSNGASSIEYSLGTGNPTDTTHAYRVAVNMNETGAYTYTFAFEYPNPNTDDLVLPTPSSITLPTAGMTCPYTYSAHYAPVVTEDATINLTLVTDTGVPVSNANVAYNYTATNGGGGTDKLTNANGQVSFDINIAATNTFTFADHAQGTTSFNTPLELTYDAGSLQGMIYEVEMVYTTVSQNAVLNINPVNSITLATLPNALITLVTDGNNFGIQGDGTFKVNVNLSGNHTVVWGPVAGYITPAPTVVDLSTASNNDEIDVTGLYVPGTTEIVDMIARHSETGLLMDDVSITVDGNTSPIEGYYFNSYAVNSVINVVFENLPSYDTPVIYVAGVSQGKRQSINHTVSDNRDDNLILAVYSPLEVYGFNVNMEGGNGTETFTLDGASIASSFNRTDLTGERIEFSDSEGYNSPSNVILNATIVVPSGVKITQGSTTYNAGDPVTFERGKTYTITGLYTSAFTVTKTVSASSVNDNDLLTYTISVTNNTNMNNVDVIVTDTVTGINQIAGTNGGQASYVINSGNCSGVTCSGENVNETGGLTLTMDSGATATITYEARVSNAGIPVNNSSVATNTVSATPTGSAAITAQAAITIAGPTQQVTPPSGGGGGGGGVIIYKGDMELQIEKLVSLDGKTYADASKLATAQVVPERKESKLYHKVVITNLGRVTAADIILKHAFETGDSDMSLVAEVSNFVGAIYNDKKNVIKVLKVPVNKTAEFTYTTTIFEAGKNDQPAIDSLELVDFGSNLFRTQDFLTYLGLGEKTKSYLFAGKIPGWVDGVPTPDNFIRTIVKTNPAEARVGETVTFQIELTNITDHDLSDLFITHEYDPSVLKIVKTFGGLNTGREIQWKRGILRPGEVARYQVKGIVQSGAPLNTMIENVTRVMVNEYEGVAYSRNQFRIIGGIPAVTGSYELAQTGPASIFLILMLLTILAYFGQRSAMQYRFGRIKALALRPL